MSLAVSYDSLRREVARFLGHDRDPDNWTADEATDVADILASGLRRFYFPLTGEGTRYAWMFLRPKKTLDLEIGTNLYDLPENFGGLLSKGFTHAADVDEFRVSAEYDETIRTLISRENLSGAPRYFAVRPKEKQVLGQTRYEVLLYPTPDKAYTLEYRYSLIPEALDVDNPNPYGGELHAETIREACLAAAEETLNDTQGMHSQTFSSLLAASIQIDAEIGLGG